MVFPRLEGVHRIACGTYSVSVSVAVAIRASADFKEGGNSRPRFSARRRMPRQALGESQYFGGTSGSRISASEQEDPSPSLDHSEVLRVKNPPGPHIPEVRQPSKDDAEVGSSVAGKQARDVLDKNPGGAEFSDDAMELEPEPAACAIKPRTTARNAEILAGEAAADDVDRRES